jgi:kynureninase
MKKILITIGILIVAIAIPLRSWLIEPLSAQDAPITDIREGEISLTSLFIEIEKAKAEKKGITLDTADIAVPRQFDFRMNVPKKK